MPAIFPTTEPNISLRVLPKIPATLQAASGLSVQKVNGIWTILPKWESLPLVVPTNFTENEVWIRNTTTGAYARTPLSSVGGTAALIANVPAGNIASTNVQDAINELDAEKRQKLVAPRTYYVRTDGNDANDGLTNTPGGAFKTLQRAYSIISVYDTAGQPMTIQVGPGTYSAGILFNIPWLVGAQVNVYGDVTTPSNVVINSSGDCFNINCPLSGKLVIEGFKLISSGGSAIVVGGVSDILIGKMEFGACATAHIYLAAPGAYLHHYAAPSITGAAQYHLLANAPGCNYFNGFATTIVGTLAFTVFAYCTSGAQLVDLGGYSGGTVTGQRYQASLNGIINTNGGGVNYFPGNAAGILTSGGQYV